MKYRVIAHSKDTGQKMVLEFEAQSKADAERKAKPHNVNIIRVEPVEAVVEGEQKEWRTIEQRGGVRIPWMLLIVIGLGAGLYYFWPVIHGMIGTLHPAATSRPAPISPE